MGVAAADHAGLEGVDPELGLQLQPQLERRADVVALQHAASLPAPCLPKLKSQRSKLANSSVGERKGWVSLSPLIWVDFHQRFMAGARLRIGAVDRFAVEGSAANIMPLLRLPLCGMASTWPPVFASYSVHILPEIRRILAVEGRKGQHLVHPIGAVAEDDGAMQVVPARRAGPFEAVKCGEDARLYSMLGRDGGLRPGRAGEFVALEDRHAGLHRDDRFDGGLHALLRARLRHLVPALALRIFEKLGAARANLIGDAQDTRHDR